MNVRSRSEALNHLILTIGLVGITGLLVYVLVVLLQVESKWLVYIAGIIVVGVSFLAIPKKDQVLWAMLVLGFQFDVYLRIFYGRAGTGGLIFGFPFVMACAVIGWPIIQSGRVRIRSISWGESMSIPIALVFVTMLVSLATSDETFAGVRYLIVHGQYLFLYLVARNCITTERRLRTTIGIFFVVLVIQSLVYFVQSWLGVTFTLTGEVIDATGRSSDAPRPGGTVTTNPAGFASFIMPLICLAASLLLSARQTARPVVRFGLPLVLGLSAIVLTITRAAWMSTFLGLTVVVWLSFRRGILSKTKMLGLGGLAALVFVVGIPLMLDRLEDAPAESSFNGRIELMQVAWEMIKAEPLTGVGPGTYRFAISKYVTPDLQTVWRAEVHNYYLLRTAETGILGGLAFLSMMLVGLSQAIQVSRSSNRNIRAIGVGLVGGIAALSFEMLWDIWGGYTYNALLWFLFGVTGAAKAIDSQQTRVARSAPRELVNVEN